MQQRGSNASRQSQPGVNAGVPAVLELAALDDLGPLTRAAICNAPLGVLAYSIVSQVVGVNDKIHAENIQRAALDMPLRPYLDPKDPRLDFNLAKGVKQHQFNLLAADRTPEDAQMGLVPLRGRPSPKSMREQRKAMRGTRRWSTSG